MLIFVDEREEKRKEEEARERWRQEILERNAKNYQRVLEETKKGRSLEDILDDIYCDSLGVEDQFFYMERRRVQKFLESL